MYISKCGSPFLMRALYTAAGVATFHNSEPSAYFERLSKRRKYHHFTVSVFIRKLFFIISSVLSENRPNKHRLHNKTKVDLASDQIEPV